LSDFWSNRFGITTAGYSEEATGRIPHVLPERCAPTLSSNLLEPDRGLRLAIVGSVDVAQALGVERYATAESALNATPAADAFLIAEHDPDAVAMAAALIRADRIAAALPLYVLAGAPCASALVDGAVRDAAEAVMLARPLVEALAVLPEGSDEPDADVRLARYLYARQSSRIEPVRTWNDPHGYRYPLLEALADRVEDVQPWMRSLVARRILTPVALIDRLRHCPSCDFAHSNYVDVCPHDEALDIVQTTFLHCFTCGNVAPEGAFVAGGRLQCPKCATLLRQIGVDYDRALESYHCNVDGADFAEPKVVAICLNCERRSAPEELVPRTVHAWALSEQGKAAARTERIGDIYALLDELDFATPQFFYTTLDWLAAKRRRYHDEEFSFVGARLKGVEGSAERLGRVRVAVVLDEVARRLRELIRGTDIATRTAENEIWILLPNTGMEGAAVLAAKLRALADHGDDIGVAISTLVVLADELADGEKAETVIARAANGFA